MHHKREYIGILMGVDSRKYIKTKHENIVSFSEFSVPGHKCATQRGWLAKA